MWLTNFSTFAWGLSLRRRNCGGVMTSTCISPLSGGDFHRGRANADQWKHAVNHFPTFGWGLSLRRNVEEERLPRPQISPLSGGDFH